MQALPRLCAQGFPGVKLRRTIVLKRGRQVKSPRIDRLVNLEGIQVGQVDQKVNAINA